MNTKDISLTGDMNERITVQTATNTADASGGYSIVWNDTLNLWAMVTPLTAGEKWQFGQLSALAGYRFTIRRRTDIDTSQRIVWRNATLNIRAITHSPNRRTSDILADSGDAT